MQQANERRFAMPIVSFEFSDEALQKLNEIRKKAEARTNAEVFRDALRIYEWILKTEAEGNKLALIKPDGSVSEVEIQY
jgi:metal-responsive CopG/Arc/MetJ family transcriptional regulator